MTISSPWGKLVILNAPKVVEKVLEKSSYTVGRDLSADVVVADVQCSKSHFRIMLVSGMPCLEDMSRNGTILNGVLIHNKRVPLPHKAEIELKYDHHFVFLNSQEEFTNPANLIQKRYYLFDTKVFGHGSYATVRLAIDKHTAIRYACKVIDTRRILMMNPSAGSTIDQEVRVLKQVCHPNIVGIHDVVCTSYYMYIFLTRVCGGELFDYIVRHRRVDETHAKVMFYQLLLAVDYLHDRNICHRDIKAENLLLESEKPISRLLITDFGMAKLTYVDQMQTKCGTFTYLAPEIIMSPTGTYTKQVDCWALGVLLYTMLAGVLPFGGHHDQSVLVNRILNAQYSFSGDVWNDIQPEAKELIQGLLQKDPKQRLTVKQALKHPWIQNQHELLEKVYHKIMVKAGIDVNIYKKSVSRHSSHESGSTTSS